VANKRQLLSSDIMYSRKKKQKTVTAGDTLNRSIGVHFFLETIPILASTILYTI
jgi:hypothetical protein